MRSGPDATDPAAGRDGLAGALSSTGPAVVAVAGCLLLVARPVLVTATHRRVPVLLAVFVTIGLVGWTWPLPGPDGAASGRPDSPRPAGSGPWWRSALVVFAVGAGAFGLGRMFAGGRSPGPVTLGLLAANSLAAVAEEAFFRRLLYRLLSPSGPAWAIGGSAVGFAVVHVTTYGYWVLPIDLAAGAVLGWQRWACGTWAVPAATHVVANILVVI